MRRFLAYFLAVTAGSTVAFASFLNVPDAVTPEMALQEAATETAPTPEMAQMFQELRGRSRHRIAARRSEVALADYQLGN